MNTAAGLCTTSPLQAALQLPSDPAAQLATGGDFTSVLAAACTAGPEAVIPEGMQSAAALAWLAGIVSPIGPMRAPAMTDSLNASPDTPVADLQDSGEVVPEAALSFLQGMLAPVVPIAPRDPVVESGVVPAATDISGAGPAVVLTAESVVNDIHAGTVAANRADPVAAPLPSVRTTNSGMQPDAPAPGQSDPGLTASVITEIAATDDGQAESSAGERLVGALADRASMRTEGAGAFVDTDRSVSAAQNLYTSTRETVASAAGGVSTRPEVVHSTVGSPRWANELGSRLAMMSVRGQQEGSLSLTPEHLGPLEVRISVNQDTTNVWFGAQHADTRAALTEALPRLREMFAASGLALGHAGVSHQMPGQEARRGEAALARVGADPEPVEAAPVRAIRISSGLLDTWA
jgi:flagellar hook-length control protein FliK